MREQLALYAPEHLAQRPLTIDGPVIDIVASSPPRQAFVFRKMLQKGERSGKPGDLVRVVLENGDVLGYGLYNPRSEIAVRLLTFGETVPDLNWWDQRFARAIEFREETLALQERFGACRLIHAEADGLPGLMVDRYANVLSVEAFSLGVYQRAEAILTRLMKLTRTEHAIVKAGPFTADQESFTAEPYATEGFPTQVTVEENGTKFVVDFLSGHKTGFFCDQRENRAQFAALCAGKRVLDLCCYTGAFGLQAITQGHAAEVTCVDLDEKALATARENARLNGAKINFVHADAFDFAREALNQRHRYDVVVLDPPKLIRTRNEYDEGRNKYFDLNRLASQLVKSGGILLTCSCSGLMGHEEFIRLASAAVEPGRRGQIFRQSGAAADHPIGLRLPETEYLKAVWMRLE